MEKLDFEGRVAVVTGGGRGIGRAHAIMLASRGARVVVNDLASNDGNESAAHSVVREICEAGGTATASEYDILTEAEHIIDDAITAYGRLDIVVNNAGFVLNTLFSEPDLTDWQRQFDVHFYGTVRVTHAAWPHLVTSGSGRVISTASSGMLGNAGLSSYGAAKAATWSFMRSIAMEGAPYNILAHSILPTAKTRLTANIADEGVVAAIDKYFQPEHVSAFVTWLAHQDTTLSGDAWSVSAGRARRMTFAAHPAARVSESTPEMWAAKAHELLAEGAITRINATAELLGDELANAAPDVRHAMAGETPGLALNLNREIVD